MNSINLLEIVKSGNYAERIEDIPRDIDGNYIIVYDEVKKTGTKINNFGFYKVVSGIGIIEGMFHFDAKNIFINVRYIKIDCT